jgi:hypothetical protein
MDEERDMSETNQEERIRGVMLHGKITQSKNFRARMKAVFVPGRNRCWQRGRIAHPVRRRALAGASERSG